MYSTRVLNECVYIIPSSNTNLLFCLIHLFMWKTRVKKSKEREHHGSYHDVMTISLALPFLVVVGCCQAKSRTQMLCINMLSPTSPVLLKKLIIKLCSRCHRECQAKRKRGWRVKLMENKRCRMLFSLSRRWCIGQPVKAAKCCTLFPTKRERQGVYDSSKVILVSLFSQSRWWTKKMGDKRRTRNTRSIPDTTTLHVNWTSQIKEA